MMAAMNAMGGRMSRIVVVARWKSRLEVETMNGLFKICDYCGNVIEKKLLKVGPTLTFCDRDCYERDCLKRFPGTSLAGMVMAMRPELKEARSK